MNQNYTLVFNKLSLYTKILRNDWQNQRFINTQYRMNLIKFHGWQKIPQAQIVKRVSLLPKTEALQVFILVFEKRFSSLTYSNEFCEHDNTKDINIYYSGR